MGTENARPLIVDLFAGPGGWSEGLRELGYADIGIERDLAACQTRAAAGHLTIRADVTTFPLERLAGKVTGLIASPPCTDFSMAGNRAGIEGDTGKLMWEVPRWVDGLRPSWVACEQVPPALPWWEQFAHTFQGWGYRTWTGLLNAADYGVPQTRTRAFLLASLEFPPQAPAPTHARHPEPPLFGDELQPWVSMADALGWDDFDAVYQRGAGMCDRHGERPPRPSESPAPTLTGTALGAGAGAKLKFVIRTGNNSRAKAGDYDERSIDEPAPTVDGKFYFTLHTNRGQNEAGERQTRDTSAPAPALSAKAGGQWCFDRLATTVAADPRLADPGHRDRKGGERQFSSDAIRLTVRDALILQSFPPDYPVQGSKTKQFEQVGNAVPPRLAAHVLAQFVGASVVVGKKP